MPKEKPDACHKYTCDIQSCLQKNDFKQEKCQHLVDKLYECCRSYALLMTNDILTSVGSTENIRIRRLLHRVRRERP